MPRILKKPLKPAVGLVRLVCERYDQALRRFLLRRSAGDPHLARDLAQEVYLRLMKADDEESIRSPKSFMYRTACNVAAEYRRKEIRQGLTFDADMESYEGMDSALSGFGGGQSSNDDIDLQMDLQNELKGMLERLHPTMRSVLLLNKRDGMSYQEVAEQLGLSVHTVKKYVCRALSELRANHLDRHLQGGRHEIPK